MHIDFMLLSLLLSLCDGKAGSSDGGGVVVRKEKA